MQARYFGLAVMVCAIAPGFQLTCLYFDDLSSWRRVGGSSRLAGLWQKMVKSKRAARPGAGAGQYLPYDACCYR
jgi:hypothetical protein